MELNTLIGLILGLSVIVVLFIFLRDFICWYFKINERVELLQEIRDLLKQKETINQIDQ